MVKLEKGNQVYTVSEDSALYRQLVDNGFEEKEIEVEVDREAIKAELTELGIEFKDNAPTEKLIKLLEGA